jgi:hypothetical protein
MTINEYTGHSVLVTIKCSPDAIGSEIDKAADTIKDVWRICSDRVMVTGIEFKAVSPTQEADIYWHYIEFKLQRR